MKFKKFDQFLNEELTDDELERQKVPTHIVREDLKIEGDLLLQKRDYVFLDREGERCITITGYQKGIITDFMSNEEIDQYLQPLTASQVSAWKYGLAESVNIKLDKQLREFELTHKSDALFSVKSTDFQKEFFVTPYNSESLKVLPEIEEKLEKAIESLNVNDMYSAITAAERVPYTYGNIFTSVFSLKAVPGLTTEIDSELQRVLNSSEKEFLMNNFGQLNKDNKDLIINELRDRAELLCIVIEALFYYVRSIDKDKFYDGMSSDEVLEKYEEEVDKASKEVSFSFDGPFSDIKTRAAIENTSEKAFWLCEKDQKKFIIKATISPAQLQSEDQIGSTSGLKFSISIDSNDSDEKDFNFFDMTELTNRVKLFNSKILKKL